MGFINLMLKYNLISGVSLVWGDSFVHVSGPKGSLIKKKSAFSLAINDFTLYLWSDENPEQEGAYLAWLHQLIVGVTRGYNKKLKLVGVGYRALLENNNLTLKLGYSHLIQYQIPQDITIMPSKNKGVLLLIKGIEFVRVNQVASEIRSFRKPDSYKGKGIHYQGEILNLKKGKREGK